MSAGVAPPRRAWESAAGGACFRIGLSCWMGNPFLRGGTSNSSVRGVSPAYFRTMGYSVLKVAISRIETSPPWWRFVSESFARKFSAARNDSAQSVLGEIVGVSETVAI